MSTDLTRDLPLGNDFEIGISLSAFDTTTKAVIATAGQTVYGLLSASPTGDEIHASLKVQLSSQTMTTFNGKAAPRPRSYLRLGVMVRPVIH